MYAGMNIECVRALKGLSGSSRLHFTLAAVPVLFVHATVTVAKTRTSATPNENNMVTGAV